MSWLLGFNPAPHVSPTIGTRADLYRNHPTYHMLADNVIGGTHVHKRLRSIPVEQVGGSAYNPLALPILQNDDKLRVPPDPAKYFTDRMISDRVVPQPHWWSDLHQTLTHNPGHLLWTLSSTVVDALKYIGWNYLDFIDQWKSWDGTWLGLVRHSSLMWRSVVTVLITAGLIQAGPLFLALTEWAGMLGSVLSTTFGLVGEALELLWRVVDDLLAYLGDIVRSLSRVL